MCAEWQAGFGTGCLLYSWPLDDGLWFSDIFFFSLKKICYEWILPIEMLNLGEKEDFALLDPFKLQVAICSNF